MSKLTKIVSVVSVFLPLAASAQSTIDALVGRILATSNLIIGLLFVLATLLFLWGLVKFIAKADEPAERAKAKGLMLWGIIAMAIMAAAWGISQLLLVYVLGGTGTAAPTVVKPPKF